MPGADFSYTDRVIYLLKQGRALDALNCCDKALALDPRNDTILNNKAVTLISLNRYEEALLHAKKAAEINPRLADTWLNMGVALDKLGREKEAASALRHAILIYPYNPYAHALLGIIYQKMDLPDCAEAQNRKLQELVFPRRYAGLYFALAAFLLGMLLGGIYSVPGKSVGIGIVSEAVLVLLFCVLSLIYLRSEHIWEDGGRSRFSSPAAATGHHAEPAGICLLPVGGLFLVFVLGILTGSFIWTVIH
jgi:tetratricopeptide (TPR) repeat protein